jgi:tetratricopeptide (TPR) repeat protein
VSEVVAAIMQIPIAAAVPTVEDEDESVFFNSSANDEIDSLSLSESNLVPAWVDVWNQEEDNYYGLGDCLQDYEEAMRLYKEAAKLGCNLAYYRLGDIYYFGQGVSENISKAFSWFKEGAKKANYCCYLKMARLFVEEKNYDNAQKCIQFFFRERSTKFDPIIEKESFVVPELSRYIAFAIRQGVSIPKEFHRDIVAERDHLLEQYEKQIEQARRSGHGSVVDNIIQHYIAAQTWVATL